MNDIAGGVFDGKHQIRSVIGEGGWGVVYRAFRPDLNWEFALKVLKNPAGGFDELAMKQIRY